MTDPAPMTDQAPTTDQPQMGHQAPTAQRPSRRPVPDRYVLLAAAAVVVLVLILRLVTDYVPGVADLLGFDPVLIVALVIVTGLVLVRAMRPRNPAG